MAENWSLTLCMMFYDRGKTPEVRQPQRMCVRADWVCGWVFRRRSSKSHRIALIRACTDRAEGEYNK